MRSEGQIQSKKHENRLAKAVNGGTVAASGAFWSRKGDVRNELYLFEHKWTGKKSFSIKSDVVEKIVKEAILDGRTAALGISLNDHNYILIEEDHFLELRGIIDGRAYESMQQMQDDISSNT